MSMVELLNQTRRLTGKYQTPFGIAVWGFTAPGDAREVLVDDAGRLQIDAITMGDPPSLDVLLSSRAAEATTEAIRALLDSLEDVLVSVGTDELRVISV